jgi:hypothetical protein
MLTSSLAQVAAYNCVSRFLVALDGEYCVGVLDRSSAKRWQLERRTGSSLPCSLDPEGDAGPLLCTVLQRCITVVPRARARGNQ